MRGTPERAFVIAGRAEAMSWAGLLIGMFFKYVVVKNEIGVQVFGPIHGGIFVAYLIATGVVARRRHWPAGALAVAVLASVPPLCTLLAERYATRRGLLGTPATSPVAAR